ncbi:LysR substrate-binding domain-containing protein [Xylophilus sp.]|uniref:LysR substrate-binding domain-containing protein n=1 Tax=Xylophilus sp. TaxID=2653893 RepID=UPI002D80B599|nr:LysR substrate-binding domain-containing protein [Xylophilus sp.]
MPPASALLSRLRIKHLRLIDVLARTGSLRRIAAALNVSQPAATKILQDLEEVLGVQLFDRSPRAVHINAMGEFVARYARRMLQETERFDQDLQVLVQGGAGTLTIGAIMAACTTLLPAALVELKRRRPLLAVRLIESSSDRLLSDLEKNEFDLVLGRFSRQHHPLAFDFVPLRGEALCVFVRADHPSARAGSLAPLVGLPWLLQPDLTPTRMLVQEAFAAAGLALPRNVVETASIYATLNLVKNSDTVAVLPRAVVQAEGPTLQTLPIELGRDLSPFGIVTRKAVELTPAAAEMKRLLLDLQEGAVP